MKTFAQAAIILMIVMVTVVVCFNYMTADVTDTEVEKTLSQSVEQALHTTLSDKSYSVESKDEFIADFTINLLSQTSSKADLKLRILAVDENAGLMDVEVIQTFKYPDSKERQIKCRKTVVFEQDA